MFFPTADVQLCLLANVSFPFELTRSFSIYSSENTRCDLGLWMNALVPKTLIIKIGKNTMR